MHKLMMHETDRMKAICLAREEGRHNYLHQVELRLFHLNIHGTQMMTLSKQGIHYCSNFTFSDEFHSVKMFQTPTH